MTSASSRIGPTALYTGHVWQRHGLAPPALATVSGRVLYAAVEPLVRLASRAASGATIESFLVARHRRIDALLAERIERGEIGQVVEIAAGLSGRGHRFAVRYGGGGLVYVEGDLPGMADRKARALDRGGLRLAHHPVAHLDALADAGDSSLFGAPTRILDSSRGTAVVCEGLCSYLDGRTLRAFWARIARFLSAFPHGVFLADVYLANRATMAPVARLFRRALGLFARTHVHLHFSTERELVGACLREGFARAEVSWPEGQPRAHVAVLEAHVERVG